MKIEVKNNNPMGLVYTKRAVYVGKIKDPELKKDKEYEEFEDYAYGLRAAIMYMKKIIQSGLVRPEEIVRKFCFDQHNDEIIEEGQFVRDYLDKVVAFYKKENTPYDPDYHFFWWDMSAIYSLVAAICFIESGVKIPAADFTACWIWLNNSNPSHAKKKFTGDKK